MNASRQKGSFKSQAGSGVLPPSRNYNLINSSFMGPVFDPSRRKAVLANAEATLSQIGPLDGVTLVGTGLSGSASAPLIAHQCDISCTLVRKTGEKTKTDYNTLIEGEMDFDCFVIVDDIIDTGETIERVSREIKSMNPDATLLGIMLYSQNESFEAYEARFGCWIRPI